MIAETIRTQDVLGDRLRAATAIGAELCVKYEIPFKELQPIVRRGILGEVTMKKWWKGFVARHIVADDPHPELSRLDRMDGLTSSELGVVELTTLTGDLSRASIDSLLSEIRRRALASNPEDAQSWPPWLVRR